ncbi:hypothetical protein M409DRAFT_18805 [Zasmidium cellare ATCC 36951]|uniref:Heterokaryon incompatibility domain-containing protein n=1 Tax=Zasmidium cellare ATCC 36951 TaxID=1080233 RepID=A0A6A6CY76_ZASCE|nr:uncharacterized protein M409DRAFT_18805 [Zasmidium cellare ATCC 36951]KAF2170832.1 hypothetical protein M409DRAFT_18805 [Zasmidium cellare ATCC 36951]
MEVPPTSSANRTVVPHTLCRWCRRFVLNLQSDLDDATENGQRFYSHFDDIRKLIQGAQEFQCHLCSILLVNLEERNESTGVDAIIEKTKTTNLIPSNRVLITYLQETPKYSKHPWKAFNICVGTTKADGSEPLEIAALAHLMHNLEGELEYETPKPQSKFLDIARTRLSAWTHSYEHMQLVKAWLAACITRHESCRPRPGLRKPTRLLEISGDGDMIKLVPGAASPRANYAALSYCWGQVPQLMLLRSNYSNFESGLPVSSLTMVAQDAIIVCRALAIRYLWIDAMCIVQGEDGDFKQEAARMEDVYAGSLVTLVAAAARDTTEHFLKERNPLPWMDCPLYFGDSHCYRTYVEGRVFCEYGKNIPGFFALDARGWCFQERLLSPRSLYFGSNGLHWECRGGLGCEYYPKVAAKHGALDDGLHAQNALKNTYVAINELDSDLTDPMVSFRFRELWGVVLERYFDTNLSFEKDRLVAMVGLARSLEHKFEIQASYGLWLAFLLDELLWSVDTVSNDTTRNLDIAPSWSWVNLRDCKIFCSNTLHKGEIGEEHRLVDSMSADVVEPPKATDFTASMTGDFSKRQKQDDLSDVVRLRGRLRRCVKRCTKAKRSGASVIFLDPFEYPEEKTRNAAVCRLDQATQHDQNLYCFLVRREYRTDIERTSTSHENSHVDTIWDHGLVLTRTDEGTYGYRRVGFFTDEPDARELQHVYASGGRGDDLMYLFPGLREDSKVEIAII